MGLEVVWGLNSGRCEGKPRRQAQAAGSAGLSVTWSVTGRGARHLTQLTLDKWAECLLRVWWQVASNRTEWCPSTSGYWTSMITPPPSPFSMRQTCAKVSRVARYRALGFGGGMGGAHELCGRWVVSLQRQLLALPQRVKCEYYYWDTVIILLKIYSENMVTIRKLIVNYFQEGPNNKDK